MSPRRFALLAVASAAAVVLELAGLDQACRYATPMLLLALPLAFHRYPGASLLSARLEPRRSMAVPLLATPVRSWETRHARLLPRGGVLSAGCLAGRGPPRASRPIVRPLQGGSMRIASTTTAAFAAALAFAAPAAAHMTTVQTEAPSDGYVKLDFQVPHGCEGDPTRVVRVRIPESVPTVTPQVKPGWRLSTEEGPKEEVELFGETVTEGTSEVSWTATGQALPDEYLDVFSMSAKMPAAEGESVYFPAIQECAGGATERWIEVPAEGESADDLEAGAPSVTLVAAEGGHGGGGGGAASDQPETAVQAASAAGGGDGASTGLVIAALVLGGLGLAAGAASLLGARRRGA